MTWTKHDYEPPLKLSGKSAQDLSCSFNIAQGCISCGPCSCPELTEDHVLPSAYVEIFRTVTRNAVNKSFWRKKDCSWPPLNKYAMNIWLSSLKIRAHLSWRTGKHLHVLHVLRTCSTCSYPGYQDTATYAALTGPWKQALDLSIKIVSGGCPTLLDLLTRKFCRGVCRKFISAAITRHIIILW